MCPSTKHHHTTIPMTRVDACHHLQQSASGNLYALSHMHINVCSGGHIILRRTEGVHCRPQKRIVNAVRTLSAE